MKTFIHQSAVEDIEQHHETRYYKSTQRAQTSVTHHYKQMKFR